MRRGKLLLITLSVVLAGITAALPYQRLAPRQLRPADEAALPLHGSPVAGQGDLVTLSLSAIEDPASGSIRSPAADFLKAAQQDRQPMLEIPEIRRDDALRASSAVPDLEPTFRPFTETIRMLRAADAPQPARLASSAASLTPPPPVEFTEEPADSVAMRRHRITDGDTLARLAERYYGDGALAEEIYRANTTVLENPQVLPLGVELAIPNLPATNLQQGGVLGAPQSAKPSPHGELAPIPPQLFDAG